MRITLVSPAAAIAEHESECDAFIAGMRPARWRVQALWNGPSHASRGVGLRAERNT